MLSCPRDSMQTQFRDEGSLEGFWHEPLFKGKRTWSLRSTRTCRRKDFWSGRGRVSRQQALSGFCRFPFHLAPSLVDTATHSRRVFTTQPRLHGRHIHRPTQKHAAPSLQPSGRQNLTITRKGSGHSNIGRHNDILYLISLLV